MFIILIFTYTANIVSALRRLILLSLYQESSQGRMNYPHSFGHPFLFLFMMKLQQVYCDVTNYKMTVLAAKSIHSWFTRATVTYNSLAAQTVHYVHAYKANSNSQNLIVRD